MDNGIGERAPMERVPWTRVRRNPTHRTSRPTDEAIRRQVGMIAAARGARPLVDTVILAALQAFEKLPEIVQLTWVSAVESETYTVRSLHGDPGEPDPPVAGG